MGCSSSNRNILTDKQLSNIKGQILYITNGQTDYDKDKKHKADSDLMTTTYYLDPPLKYVDLEDRENIYKFLHKYNIRYVFTSPMLRCLETTFHLIKDHPWNFCINIIVHPLLTEVISGTYDLSVNTCVKKETFRKTSNIIFDWSVFERLYPTPQLQEAYFLDFIDNYDKNDKEVIDIIGQLYEESTYDNLVNLMEHFKKQGKKPESLKSAYNRGLNFKNYLKGFINRHFLLKSDKVLIVTHQNFLKISNTVGAYSKLEDVTNSVQDDDVGNLEIFSININ
jgi:broad specificity phosphatase PhoE